MMTKYDKWNKEASEYFESVPKHQLYEDSLRAGIRLSSPSKIIGLKGRRIIGRNGTIMIPPHTRKSSKASKTVPSSGSGKNGLILDKEAVNEAFREIAFGNVSEISNEIEGDTVYPLMTKGKQKDFAINKQGKI
jgi:hypothetical protein